MGIQEQDFTINFSGTVDTKSDPWQVASSNFLALDNSVYTVGGRLTKRNGFPSLGKTINSTSPTTLTYSNLGPTITEGRKVFSFQDELCLNDAFNLYSYDESNNGWNYKGRSTMVGLSTSSIAQDQNSKSYMDCSIDTTSGIKVFVWYENNISDYVKFSIQDIETGQFIVNKAFFGTTYKNPRCVSISGKSFIFAVNTSDGKIYARSITGQTVGSITAIVTDLNASKNYYDVDVSSGNIYISYFTSGPAIKIAQLNSSLSVVNSITKSESATHGVSFFGDGTNIWVVYNNGTATKAFIVNNAVTSTVLAPTVVDSGATAANVTNVTGTWSSTNSKAFIFYDTTDFITNFNTLTVGGSAGTPSVFMDSVVIASKAFVISGIPHIVVGYLITAIQQSYFLLNMYNWDQVNAPVPANIAAKIAPDSGGGATGATTPGWMCGVHNSSGSIWELALGQKTDISIAGQPDQGAYFPVLYSPIGVIDCQFDFSLSNPDAQVLGNSAVIAGGQTTMYDGSGVVEQNFHTYPELVTASIMTGGSGKMGNSGFSTTYSYQFTYEWIDNAGHVHRSTPSPSLTLLSGSNNYTFASGTTDGYIVLGLQPLNVTAKSGVVVNVYRTTGNGTVYYLVASVFGVVPNTPTSRTLISYTDILSDDDLVGNNQLYTNGELPDYAPPATSALATFKNRMLFVQSEDANSFGYSKQVQVGSPVEFSPSFIQNVGTVAGPLTTIAGMDDKIILFKSGLSVGPSILYMVGTGPAPSGANNDFTDPLPVAVDCGCVDRSSVVLTPDGLIFKSDKGIYLLDRSLQASYIGAAVEGYNQYSVVSSQLIPNTTQVRFLLSSGMLLMYDYFYKKWSTFSNPAGISDCIFQGQHTYLATDGTVYKEAPGVFYDGISTPILMSFTTAHLNLASISGYERIYDFILLGKYLSSHKMQFSINYDYIGQPQQSATITPNPNKPLEQWKVDAKRQLCQSFQITFTEVYTGTLGASLYMTGITFHLGIKRGRRPIAGAASAGLS